MNITAGTVTVYFIGLMTFYDVTNTGAKVSVPWAASSKTYNGVTLTPHHADVVVMGFAGVQKDCTDRGGIWTPTTPPAPTICTFQNIRRKAIQLPNSSTPFDVKSGFTKVPHLGTLCGDISDIKAEHKDFSSGSTAALLTLTKGDLDACTNGDAWVAKLTLNGTTGDLVIGTPPTTVSVPLATTAVVGVVNEPRTGGSTTDHKRHFWWYYTMSTISTGEDGCDEIPEKDPHLCDPPIPLPGHGHSYATGVGCSNTQYP